MSTDKPLFQWLSLLKIVALFKKIWNPWQLMCTNKPLQQSHLQVETDLNAVTEVLKWFEEFTSPVLPQEFCLPCKLALDEGFTNVVRHAHQGLPKTTPIDLELRIFNHCLEMRIWDYGPPFDFQETLQKRLCLSPSDQLEQEGGRGLIFMHKLMDELSYLRLSDQRNCLLLRKSI